MAEIHLEKKARTGWIWALVALILVLALWWAWSRNDDVARSPKRSPAEVATAAWPASEPPLALVR